MAIPNIHTATMRLPGASSKTYPGPPSGVLADKHRVLVVGIMLSAGSATADACQQVTSDAQAVALFGEGSQAAAMVKAAKLHNPLVELWATGVDEDAGGTAATGTLTFTGTATEAGTIPFYVAGRRIPIAIAKGDGASDAAAKLNTAINALTRLPVTSGVALGVVTTTCRWKGASGNDVDLRVGYYPGEVVPAGLSVAVVAMSAGATDPSLAGAIAGLPADTKFDTWAIPFAEATTTTAIVDELDARAGAARGIPGQAFGVFRGIYSATAAIGAALNSESLTIFGAAATVPAPTWELAASVAAIDSGVLDLNIARKGMIVRDALPPSPGAEFDAIERNLLLQTGISTFTVENGRLLIERTITTYQTTQGAADTSYLDIGTRRALNFLRYDMQGWSVRRYAEHKVGSDEDLEFVDPGVRVATPQTIAGAVKERYLLHVGLGYMGDVATFDGTLLVELNEQEPGRVDVAGSVKVLQAAQHFAFSFSFTI